MYAHACTASRFSSNSVRPLQQPEPRLHRHRHVLVGSTYARDIRLHEVDTAYCECDSGSKGKKGAMWKDGEETTINRYQLIISTPKRSSAWTMARFYFFE